MESNENWKTIKAWLEKWHGLYITNRQVGKTRALIEILHDNPKSIVFCMNWRSCENIMDSAEKIYGSDFRQELHNDRRVFSTKGQFTGRGHKKYDLYVDEFFVCMANLPDNYMKYFKGAVSSMEFPIITCRHESEYDPNDFKTVLGDLRYRLEHSLDFPIKVVN
uniref:Uncharacterized protein n=1 Tax=viral metagenome TaxID=1070528 RepID=A0A6M3XU55_9ZZZZ